MAREQRPSGSAGASRGQSETIGVVLILALTLIGATFALAYGAAGLNAARLDSQEGSIEHALTQLDSRSAMVALGDSSTQHVPLAAAGQGHYRMDSDAGWINVTHHGYDGPGSDEVIYNESLGALVYENEDTLIAYQGGGVWVATGNASRMISPPEFHYQSATLTLPIIQVQGAGSVGGPGVTAKVTQLTRARRVYPNSSAQYPSGGDYVNPVSEGNVTVTVKSDYYEAWADYFRTRTTGEVTVDHSAETASVRLISKGTVGAFEMPADGNSIEIRGLGDGHPITNFTITIRPDDSDAASFANLQWSLYADEGSEEFEIHLRKGSDAPDAGGCDLVNVDAAVYYSDTNGDPYHGWQQDDAFTTECGDLDGDGDDETYLEVNLTGTTQLTLQSLSQSDLNHFSPGGGDAETSVTFDEHDGIANADWEPHTFDTSGDDDTTIGNLTNHYLSLMGPNVEITVEDKGSDSVNEDASSGHFEQSGGAGSFITFLHITENRVSVELQ